MSRKREATREDARRILRNGILDMSIARLIQMSQFGLIGNIILSNGIMSVENAFNHINYDEQNDIISFSVEESQASYGVISFSLNAISDISGCDDKENQKEYLNVNIKLKDGISVRLRILY